MFLGPFLRQRRGRPEVALAPRGGQAGLMVTPTPVRLVLLRHAKSAYPDVADHDRPLAPRGRRDAPVAGRWLRDAGLVPDQVVCSTARRARETWELARGGLGTAPPVRYEAQVYQAGADGLLHLVRGAPDAAGTLLIVGHNPAVQELALLLSGRDADAERDGRLRVKFPTSAIAVLEAAGPWSGFQPGAGLLTHFVTPGDM